MQLDTFQSQVTNLTPVGVCTEHSVINCDSNISRNCNKNTKVLDWNDKLFDMYLNIWTTATTDWHIWRTDKTVWNHYVYTAIHTLTKQAHPLVRQNLPSTYVPSAVNRDLTHFGVWLNQISLSQIKEHDTFAVDSFWTQLTMLSCCSAALQAYGNNCENKLKNKLRWKCLNSFEAK